MIRTFTLALIGLLPIALFGCQASEPAQPDGSPKGTTTMSIEITSPGLKEGEMIPVEYTCSGQNISPPLAWDTPPSGTQSLALVMDDPDAPAGTWVHWVLYNLPGSTRELPAGVKDLGMEGKNSSRKLGYSGPCPPPGKPHRYFFKIYALDTSLDLEPEATKAELEQAMQDHILATGQWMGTFSR